MANMMDYLDWRGDLTLAQDEFGEVDNLLLSYLAYVRLDGIAPAPGEGERSLPEISADFFRIHSEEYLKKEKSLTRLAWRVMPKMAASKRFEGIHIRNFVNYISQENKVQFCAMEILLDDGTSYVGYRGTDDTIVGWKEDFEMVIGEVPAQSTAEEYLNYVGDHCDRPLRVGGHSKGGNLAVFAAAQCKPQIRERILNIYNNDGPGFREEFLDDAGLASVKERILRIVPETAIVGLLLHHNVEPVVIKSTQTGTMQHDGMSWQVEGKYFVRCPEINKAGVMFDRTLKNWMGQIKESERGPFIEEFFSVLEAPGVETLTELQNEGMRALKAILARMDELTPESKKIMQQLIKSLFDSGTEYLAQPLIAKTEELRQSRRNDSGKPKRRPNRKLEYGKGKAKWNQKDGTDKMLPGTEGV